MQIVHVSKPLFKKIANRDVSCILAPGGERLFYGGILTVQTRKNSEETMVFVQRLKESTLDKLDPETLKKAGFKNKRKARKSLKSMTPEHSDTYPVTILDL